MNRFEPANLSSKKHLHSFWHPGGIEQQRQKVQRRRPEQNSQNCTAQDIRGIMRPQIQPGERNRKGYQKRRQTKPKRQCTQKHRRYGKRTGRMPGGKGKILRPFDEHNQVLYPVKWSVTADQIF